MIPFEQLLIIVHARECEDALAKAAIADAQGKCDVANACRAKAKYQSRQAFKLARPWGARL